VPLDGDTAVAKVSNEVPFMVTAEPKRPTPDYGERLDALDEVKLRARYQRAP
jgi:hypothetical protein